MQQKQGVIVSYLSGPYYDRCDVFDTTEIKTVVDTLLSRVGKFANDKHRDTAAQIIENGLDWRGQYLKFVNAEGQVSLTCLLAATINVK